jgi:hypothetical protein
MIVRRLRAHVLLLTVCAAAALLVAFAPGSTSIALASPPVPNCPSEGPQLVNTSPPRLTGSTAVGGTLTTSNGSWSYLGNPVTITQFNYAWHRDGVAIDYANAQSYTVTSADVGHSLYALVAAHYSCGVAGSANSNSVLIDSPDSEGSPSADQTEPTSDTTDYGVPSSPTPMTPTGACSHWVIYDRFMVNRRD